MKKSIFIPLALLSALLAISGCDLINPEEPIPGYLYIPRLEVQTELAEEGTASSNIPEAWVSVDGNFLGAYGLPATVPVLEEGPSEVVVQAGIRDNGLVNSPNLYPFFANYEVQVDIGPNTTDTIRPVFEYLDNTKFAFVEDFEDAPQLFGEVRRGDFDQLSLVSEGAFEGQSLLIELDTAASIVEAATTERYAELTGQFSTSVYLEVNYRSDVPVTFGLVGHQGIGLPGLGQTIFVAGFSPSDEWKKIYFNLSVTVVESGYDEFQIIFQAAIPIEDNQLTREEANVWIDNVKLLHF